MARFAQNLLGGLLGSQLDFSLVLLTPSTYRHPEFPTGRRVEIVPVDVPLFGIRHHWRMTRIVHSFPGTPYFYPHFDPPWFVRNETAFVVHDLLPIRVPGYMNQWKALYYRESIRRNLLRHDRRCSAVSETTRRDLFDLVTPNSYHPIGVAYEASFESTDAGEPSTSIRSLAAASPYLLYVGDRRPHKNLRRMVDIFCELRTRGWPGRFLIVGKREVFDFDLEAYVRDKPQVDILDPVSDADLRHLYRHCEALFFLTLYEGFGLPIVEAAQLGRKVITSTTGAAAEIAPPGSLLIDPQAPPANSAIPILEYLGQTKIRPDPATVAERFRWTDSAEKIFKPLLVKNRDGG